MSRLTRDGTAEPVSRDQILRCERGQGNIYFPYSTDHEQDWQPYPIGSYSCYMCDYTYIHLLCTHVNSLRFHTENYGGQCVCMVAPVVQVVTSKPSDVGTRVRVSVQSHDLGIFSRKKIKIKKAQQVEND